MSKWEKMRSWAPSVLRVGVALVFLWFGSQQFLHTALWVGIVPDSIVSMSHLSATTLVHLNGAFEIVFGLCLLFGFYVRLAAFLLFLHMLQILTIVGYNDIGVRDFGLAIACLSIFLHGPDR